MYRILLRLKRLLKRYLKIKAESRQVIDAGPRSKFYKILMLFLAAGLLSFLYPADEAFYPLDYPRKGEIAVDDIIAPFQVTVYKSDAELREERQDAADAVPIIIEYDKNVADSALSQFAQFMALIKRRSASFNKSLTGQNFDSRQVDSLISVATNSVAKAYPAIDTAVIRRLLFDSDLNLIERIIREILEESIYYYGVIPDLELLPATKNRSVVIKMDDREIYQVRDKLPDTYRANRTFRLALRQRSLSDSIDVDLCYDLGRRFIVPNLSLNIVEMQSRREEAMAEIPQVSEVINAGDVIVQAGARVEEKQERALKEIFRQQESRYREDGWYIPFIPSLARFALMLAIFGFLYAYLYNFHPLIFGSNPKLLAMFFVYGVSLVLIYISRIVETNMELSFYIYPLAILPILLTILFNARIGIFGTIILAIILGILHRFNFSLAIVTIFTGMVASYSTRRVRHRTEFFRTSIYLALSYVVLILLFESFKLSPAENITGLMGQGLFVAVVSPLLAMGIVPFFESLFGFTTDLTLLELSDLNNPLLKRLAMEAPGTYHHSILVGNLAEAAAKAIDANPLLARVGAYYHDIGKMEIPEYFVENQLGIKSKHDSLTPSVSAIILSSHVKKGRLLGEEADLPDEVLNFIEEHHGTMVMTYFYNKAKEQGDEEPSDENFRYPGPKPRTRETATVMLADSVEAASRTLTDPKPARIRNLVQNIINDRFQSGEFEDCPLTLKDLANIRESFVQILIGVFHQRVVYPKKEEKA
jgi:putative nucleotidyltransferase with HDIG domain